MYNAPGRSVTVHPARGKAIVAFIYRSPAVEGFDYRDMAQHKALLAEAYEGQGWRVPEERVQAADDLYFDQRRYLLMYREAVRWLSGGAPALTDQQREELTQVRGRLLPGAPLTWLVGLGADSLAAELAPSSA